VGAHRLGGVPAQRVGLDRADARPGGAVDLDDGNDHVTVRLAARGRVRRVEIDTSYFVGNAPGWAGVTGDAGRA
jgi:allantoicase repeat-containing protein